MFGNRKNYKCNKCGLAIEDSEINGDQACIIAYGMFCRKQEERRCSISMCFTYEKDREHPDFDGIYKGVR